MTGWWLNCLNFRQQPLGGAHALINTRRRGDFHLQLELQGSVQKQGSFTNKLLPTAAEKQLPRLNPSGSNVKEGRASIVLMTIVGEALHLPEPSAVAFSWRRER